MTSREWEWRWKTSSGNSRVCIWCLEALHLPNVGLGKAPHEWTNNSKKKSFCLRTLLKWFTMITWKRVLRKTFASNLKHYVVKASISHDCYDHTFHFKMLCFYKVIHAHGKIWSNLKGYMLNVVWESSIESWSRKGISGKNWGNSNKINS